MKEWEEAQQTHVGREAKYGKMPSKKGSQVHVVEIPSPPSAAKKNTLFIKAV